VTSSLATATTRPQIILTSAPLRRQVQDIPQDVAVTDALSAHDGVPAPGHWWTR